MTAGVIVFPVSYILNDCIAEVWGFRKARLIIWMGFLMNFFVVALGGIACALPAAVEGSDEAFKQVFAFAPQVAIASLLAFIIGSFLNAMVMSKMKIASSGRFFWLRAIVSSIAGDLLDSLIFIPIAFIGTPAKVLAGMLIAQVTFKVMYEILILPVTGWVVRRTKKSEGVDVYDRGVDYNPFKIKDIE